MKRNIRICSVLLVICMFMTSINVYALDTNKVVEEEHTFTKAELACMTDGILGTATSLSEEFIEIKNIEGKTTRASTTYYIIEMADGYMLTSPTSGTFSRTRYANSASNNVRKWIFTEDSDGDYIVYSYTDSTKCLTIDPSTKAVTLSTYEGTEYQKWRMYYSSNGNTLRSMATDSSVNGYMLVIDGSSCYVSNITYTAVGFFDVSWYTPVSTLSYPNFYLALNQTKTVTPNKSPTGAICPNNWMIWTCSYAKISVNDTGLVTGVSPGTSMLSFRDKITRNYGTCTITVMPIANGTYFLQNKGNSDYAKVKDGTMTNGQNVVQYDLGEGNEFRWIFTLDTTTGYFSIKSANSGSSNYYMAVSDDSSAIDKPIVIRSATETTLTEGMKWKIETTANDAYKIIPKTGEATDYVLATSVSLGTNNKNLLQGEYLDNDSYRDEWFLHCLNMKYINYYDSSFSGDDSLINNISSAVSFSNTVYNDLCGVTFAMKGSATQYTNFVADNCTTGEGIQCSTSACGSTCSSHHKNVINISNQFNNLSMATNERCVIWTNRSSYTYCQHLTSGVHRGFNAIAVVYNCRPVIHFMTIDGNATEQEACMTLNLVHETAHTFTMPDVYGDEHDLTSGYICIMERFEASYAYSFYQDILDGSKQPFCSSCTSDIQNRVLTNIGN